MSYTFDILGVSPVLHFFSQQQELIQQKPLMDMEYLGTHQCTLDAFLESVETVSIHKEWDLDQVLETVINFWINNPDKIWYWKERLDDAGDENLLVSRVADMQALRTTFESILGQTS